MVRTPSSANTCFARARRLRGQNRVPLPPARITGANCIPVPFPNVIGLLTNEYPNNAEPTLLRLRALHGEYSRMHQDRHIEEETAVLHVIQVVFQALVDGVLPIRTQLPEPGNSLWNIQPLPLDMIIFFDYIWHLRTRANEGHVSFEYINNLGQLIQAHLAENLASRCDARIVRVCRRSAVLRSIHIHAPKFQHIEALTMMPNAPLTKKDWPLRGMLDPNCDDQPTWRSQQ